VKLTAAGAEAAKSDPDAARPFVREVVRDAARWTSRGCTLVVRGRESCALVVPVALAEGFSFHSAEGDRATLRFFRQDSAAAEAHGGDPLPAAAHTSIATGGVVFNKAGDVLLIRQTYDPFAEWRLPGGAMDPNETMVEGAAREVLEETGVRVRAPSVLGLRQAPRYRSLFGRGFLGASVLFEAEDEAVPLRWPAEEILEARWVPLEHALRPFAREPAPDGETPAESLARARRASDGVAHGMTRSGWQRVSVIRGALARGLGPRVPAAAMRAAVDGGCVTEEEARPGAPAPPASLREVFHADGFPHGRRGVSWYALVPQGGAAAER